LMPFSCKPKIWSCINAVDQLWAAALTYRSGVQ
jgi:hypothetical protein